MSKINQIQTAILGLDGGAFQKLVDSYLLRKGYQQINSIGSVIGANKVRVGTPDTLIQTADGKYIFAEHTTYLHNRVFSKFCDDIDKCLDEEKTGIAVGRIEEIVLCYTSELSAKNIDLLRKKCEVVGVNLNLFGISSISYDLLEKYPSIAKDHLGIEVDTGQIVPLDRFISLYEQNKLATTLSTTFHFREEERKELLISLENNSLIIISGPPGVGKSRIAIECYKDFMKNNAAYKPYCILNHGIDLFEDVKSYFSDSCEYLIFVDDANRISGFQYILQLLQIQRDDQNFKIIATVRDYALDKVRDTCKAYDSVAEISLSRFTDTEIKKLVQDEFEINNHEYLDRIADISQGNPRLAIMAARIASESNTLQSIRDVSELYDSYYSSIKSDLDALNNKNILKTAGIITFFRSVDRTDKRLMSDIERAFGITSEDFWEAAKMLHDMEVLDMFENEVVKISDQVLATYLFYLVFFKEKNINFTILIDDFFPQFKQRLIDAINPILSTCDIDKTKATMLSSVDEIWCDTLENDEKVFLQLIEVFWFLKPTETLIFIQNKIEKLEPQTLGVSEVKFGKDSNNTLPDFLSALSLFRYYGKDEIDMSLDMFLQYVGKQPMNTPKVIDCFINDFGFQPDSYRYGYGIQHVVIEKMINHCDSETNEFFSRMFITIAEDYLHTHFSSTKPEGKHAITIIKFDLTESSELLKLRESIWTHLFKIYKKPHLQEYVLSLLLQHAQSGYNVSVAGIVKADSELLLEFFKSNFDSWNLYHCIIVHAYLRLLKRIEVPCLEDIKQEFTSRSYKLYHLLTDKFERRELDLSHDDYRKYKKDKIGDFTASFVIDDYNHLIRDLADILQYSEGNSKWQIEQGIASVFEELSMRDENLYLNVMKGYLLEGDVLNLHPYPLVYNLVTSCGSSVSFNVLSEVNYPSKNKWLFSYYQCLPEKEIRPHHLAELKDLFKSAQYNDFVYGLDYLLKYECLESGYIVDIVQDIADKTKADPLFAHILSPMFNDHTELNKALSSLFFTNETLLEDIYILVDRGEKHGDYDGSTFSMLLDNNPCFINRYLEDMFSRKSYISKHDDNRDYSFIWQRDDFRNVMKCISDTVFEYEQKGRSYHYYEVFFSKNVNPQSDEVIIEKKDGFLCDEIKKESNNSDYMAFIFAVMTDFNIERRIKFYQKFLENNNKFSDFESLPLEPSSSHWSGSKVPLLQGRVDFFERLISICNSVHFLKHRQLLEQRVGYLRQEIQHEKKRDFTEE